MSNRQPDLDWVPRFRLFLLILGGIVLCAVITHISMEGGDDTLVYVFMIGVIGPLVLWLTVYKIRHFSLAHLSENIVEHGFLEIIKKMLGG